MNQAFIFEEHCIIFEGIETAISDLRTNAIAKLQLADNNHDIISF